MRPNEARGPGKAPTVLPPVEGVDDAVIVDQAAPGIDPPAATTPFEPGSIPAALRERQQWVGWRSVPPRKATAKPGKIPINPHTGAYASSTDQTTWGNLDEAIAAVSKFCLDGIGFVFTAEDPFGGIDLDHCVSGDTGELDVWAAEIVRELDSYTEYSPSGTGVHVIVQGQLPDGGRKRDDVEMYDQARFFTLTGRRLAGTSAEIEKRQEQLERVHAEHVEKRNLCSSVALKPAAHLEPSALMGVTDQELIDKAKAARNGENFARLWDGDHSDYPSESEADLALCGMLAFWTGGDAQRIDRHFRASGLLRPKWDERRGERTYGERTIDKALSGMSSFYSPLRGSGEAQHAGRSSDKPELTDTGNAERYVRLFRDVVRFCHTWKEWLTWDGRRWAVDKKGRVLRRTKEVIADLYRDAASVGDLKTQEAIASWARSSQKADRRKAMLDLAKCEKGIPILPAQLDQHPLLINFKNGTLDLASGEFRTHEREDYLTRLIPQVYDPGAMCPSWTAFLERVVPDAHIRSFLKRAIGYSLTGDVSEQVLFFLYGEGANGKSTFLGAIQRGIGRDYAIQAAPDLLLAKRGQAHPTEMADLFSVRMAVCTEVGEGRRFDEVLIKQLTGGDPIRARKMRENFWEFDPTHHLWIAGNHKPEVRGTDYAIWRRILLIPFTVQIPKPERDPSLLSKLRAEAPGILAWVVEGALEWSQVSLNPPEAVLIATEVYREEMDVLAPFLCERVVNAPGARVRASDLYRAYTAWCEAQAERPMPQRKFGDRLTQKHFRRQKVGVYYYLDIAMREPESAFPGSPEGCSGPSGRSETEISMNGLVPPREDSHVSLKSGLSGSSTRALDGAAPSPNQSADAHQCDRYSDGFEDLGSDQDGPPGEDAEWGEV